MLHTQGIDAIASVSELKNNASELVAQASKMTILIQGNDSSAILISHEAYMKLLGIKPAKVAKKAPKPSSGTGKRGRPPKNPQPIEG